MGLQKVPKISGPQSCLRQQHCTIWIPTILVQKVPKLWVSSPKTVAPSTQDCWNQDQNRYRWNAKISPATHPGLWHLLSQDCNWGYSPPLKTGQKPTQHLHISSLQISWPRILEGGTGSQGLQISSEVVCECLSMHLELSSNWAARKESLLHSDSAASIQLCQSNKSAKALPGVWQRRRSIAVFKSPCQSILSLLKLKRVCASCKRRQDTMKPCCFLCKKRKVWASIIAKLPSKPYNSCIDLTSKVQIQERWSGSDMHFGRMHTLSESFPRLARLPCTSAAFETSKSEGKVCLLSVLGFSWRSENLQPGLMISIKDQWVLLNVRRKLEVRIEHREAFSL